MSAPPRERSRALGAGEFPVFTSCFPSDFGFLTLKTIHVKVIFSDSEWFLGESECFLGESKCHFFSCRDVFGRFEIHVLIGNPKTIVKTSVISRQ
jgi:hypothetical protein